MNSPFTIEKFPSARKKLTDQELADRLVAIHDELAALPELSPSPRTNFLFNELVVLVLAHEDASAVLAYPDIAARVRSFQSMCSRAETDLETFWAERGGGAWLNGRRVRVTRARDLGEALVATGFAYRRNELANDNLANFGRLALRVRGVRRHESVYGRHRARRAGRQRQGAR